MICLGCVTTAGLFWFWNTRTADYRPLADALAEALPGSSPRVEGGRRRRPDPDVSLLQVMLKVPFDPGAGDPERGPAPPPPQAAATLETVDRTVAASPFAGRYDVLEVHLRRDGPGGVITSATYTRPMPQRSSPE
ncbi:hypothetical protein [Alienimonas californiensis]|uniref:Uncharacterized protein n=1 Tax=Alienimonas californiensis TaxID=2527989 RepID=A0A517P7E8_9PLAN|nr:hypothetical protein [Alienimonas californiensis]QDT15306.1 hypothetical protein CA12_13890 [Alienimonas californiensis]